MLHISYLYRIHTVTFLPFRAYNTDNQLIINTTDVSQKYTNDDDVCNDAAFFIPVVDKIFEMTKLV